jgi:cell division protein FtsW
MIMIYSSSAILAFERYSDSEFYLKRQFLFLIIGCVILSFILGVDYRIFKRFSKPLLLFSLFLLILVLIPGIGYCVSGAKRWFKAFGFNFQPSELASLSLIIYLASFLSRKDKDIRNLFFGLLPPLIVIAIFVFLILLQPDLGKAFSVGIISFIMLYVAGARLSHCLLLFLLSLPIIYLSIFTVPYRLQRIITFLNPWLDPRGSGFQIIQSQIALGSGGVFGLGLGRGKQKLFFLPANHTDFIFSQVGEELGWVGTSFVIVLFLLFLIYGFKVIKNCKEPFGFYLGLGIVSSIILEAIIHMGVCVGLLPTKGLPLPFISYGGSAFLFDLISMGILLNIAKNSCV